MTRLFSAAAVASIFCALAWFGAGISNSAPALVWALFASTGVFAVIAAWAS